MKKTIFKTLSVFLVGGFLLTGCSVKNPFGIGYDSSACEAQEKDFGMCGSPESIYLYKDKVKAVEKDYFDSGIKQKLFFGISPNGTILVKSDRDANWEKYETSKWKVLIESKLKEKALKEKVIKNKFKINGKINLASQSLKQDIPVTQKNDLSVKYQKQGKIIETRTSKGGFIRDNGLIQPVFIAPYVDSHDDLVAGHEVYVVVKNPSWVIGEQNPSNVGRLENFPTPVSQDLLKQQNRTNIYQEKVINDYNINYKKGVLNANKNDPYQKKQENKINLDIIKQFNSEPLN